MGNQRLSELGSLVIFSLLICGTFGQLASGKSCFCKLSGSVDECECSVNSVDDFNNQKMFPLLQSLLKRDFFRYYKVNMMTGCPFWQDSRECSSKECGIDHCDDEVPAALKQKDTPNPCTEESIEKSNKFDPLDTTISQAAAKQFAVWKDFDDAENKFCDAEDDHSNDVHYVDLLRNPERYTGYSGNSAARVWKCIYQENCFKPNPKFDKNFLLHPTVTGLCLEKRVFFRLVSGLHTSITISIAAHNYQPPAAGFGQGKWVRNVNFFKARFSPETTWGEGPQRLKNLYFVYLLELRALQKVAPYLRGEFFYTGKEAEDAETRDIIAQLMQIVSEFPEHFDESSMFQYVESHARELKEEFRQHFLNISRIMDCVDCDKCRLWGKLQTHGMGSALKILLSDIPRRKRAGQEDVALPFQLSRNEVVALFNSLGRYASSIREVAEFRKVMEK